MRQSYREGGRVKNRTIANLNHCKPEEIAALELALQQKEDLTALTSLNQSVSLRKGNFRYVTPSTFGNEGLAISNWQGIHRSLANELFFARIQLNSK